MVSGFVIVKIGNAPQNAGEVGKGRDDEVGSKRHEEQEEAVRILCGQIKYYPQSPK